MRARALGVAKRPLSEIQSASGALSVQSPVTAAPSLLRHHLEFEPPQHLTAELFPQSWQPSLPCGAAR